MTDLLEMAVTTARSLSPDMQDEIARMVLAFAGEDLAPYRPTAEEAAELDLSMAAAARGDFATDEQMTAMWAKHGL